MKFSWLLVAGQLGLGTPIWAAAIEELRLAAGSPELISVALPQATNIVSPSRISTQNGSPDSRPQKIFESVKRYGAHGPASAREPESYRIENIGPTANRPYVESDIIVYGVRDGQGQFVVTEVTLLLFHSKLNAQDGSKLSNYWTFRTNDSMTKWVFRHQTVVERPDGSIASRTVDYGPPGPDAYRTFNMLLDYWADLRARAGVNTDAPVKKDSFDIFRRFELPDVEQFPTGDLPPKPI